MGIINSELPELIKAVKEGSYKKAKRLLDEGADVNIQDDEGWTPLMWATVYRNKKIVKLLIKNGADKSIRNNFGWTASKWVEKILENDNTSIDEKIKDNILKEEKINEYQQVNYLGGYTLIEKQKIDDGVLILNNNNLVYEKENNPLIEIYFDTIDKISIRTKDGFSNDIIGLDSSLIYQLEDDKKYLVIQFKNELQEDTSVIFEFKDNDINKVISKINKTRLNYEKEKNKQVDVTEKIENTKEVKEDKSKDGVITCPNCGSENVKKITFKSKAGSAVLFGIFSMGKLTKSYKCNDCGYKW